MGMRFGPGPVFEAECLTASRRVQFYSARVLLLLGLMVGLAVAWVSHRQKTGNSTLQELARIGNSFYAALMGVELTLALLVAPAAAAGAICQDRAKGGLALMMTTDLTDSEIVLGRLASRLLSTLGVVACGLPVLALATLLGGVDPVAIAGGTLVVVGVACLSVAMALAFSLWAGKSHEALSATYAIWAVWMLAYPAWYELFRRSPEWLWGSNPFGLIFSTLRTPNDRLPYQVLFLAGCLVGTAVLAALSTSKLRAETLHRQARPAKRAKARRSASGLLRWIGQGAPALDDDPILWREWHRKRPSSFTRAIWWTYAVIGTLFTVTNLFGRNAPLVNAFQASIGLLLACVGAATSLAEERVQGGLDVVLATPLASSRIVLGKWWGAFRIIPRLAILPGLLVFLLGLRRHPLPETLMITALVVGLMLAYGATFTGLGLLIAIHQPRQGRAVALTVACYLAVTLAYPAIVLPIFNLAPRDSLPLWPSPFFGIIVPTIAIDRPSPGLDEVAPAFAFGFLASEALVAFVLLKASLGSFDRALGRVVDRSAGGDLEDGVSVPILADSRA